MNVVIKINDREAIPVRALPWLTAWEFSAQEVAEALAHDNGYESFAKLDAYRLDEGVIQAVRVGEWLNSVTVSIEEFSERKLPRAEWQRLSISAIPADAFVWRDEWESAYNQSPYGPDALAALGDAADGQDIADRTLNFAPHIPPGLVHLVMEGFTQREVRAPAPAATTAPVVTSHDRPKKHSASKPSIEVVALVYMRELYRTGQFQSAAQFHKHLTLTAGVNNSPFEIGTGINARKLFCPAASSFFDAGTLSKMWAKIRAD